ncbi:MAG: Sir2 family NAD-dependent protein deacetylase [Acidobacteriota bacterium]
MERDAAGAIADMLRKSRRAIALTGAGISTESGIPDFRSPGGVWSRESPVMYQDFLASASERRRYWRMRRAMYPAMRDAAPNAGHVALADLGRAGKLSLLITQNIDGLHQLAGTSGDALIEIHGNARRVVCLECGHEVAMDRVFEELDRGALEPACERCRGIVKSATVSFGQPLPPEVLERAFAAASTCDLFLVVGSSLVVEPAASLPRVARQRGAGLAIVTMSETPLDRLADVVAHEACGELLRRVASRLSS